MAHYEHASLITSKMLDDLGYGKSMVSFRRHMNNIVESVYNDRFCNDFHTLIIIAGSKAEGLTSPLENDLDTMQVNLDVVCKENFRTLRHEEEVHKFQLEMNNSCPGYTLLRNINICSTLPSKDFFYENMMCIGPEKYYLSSDFFKNSFKQPITEQCDLLRNHGYADVDSEAHGPSITTHFILNSKDQVMALTCECPTYMTAWKCRQRLYQWPPDNVIREVSSLESHVVPVGPTTSSIRFLEWRICFTKGEIRLIHSLNDCLTKVLYMLKEITKVTLKPISKDISSYTIKNIIFWLAELNNYDLFSQNNLIMILRTGLTYLKRCILQNYLSNYMIPQRNLFDGKFTNQQRTKMCMRIDSLLKEGVTIVMKCAKFRYALSCSRMEFRSFSKMLHQYQIFFYFFLFLAVKNLPLKITPVDGIKYILSNDVTRFMFKNILIEQWEDPDDVEEVLIELEDVFSNYPHEYLHVYRELNLAHNVEPYLF